MHSSTAKAVAKHQKGISNSDRSSYRNFQFLFQNFPFVSISYIEIDIFHHSGFAGFCGK